MLTKKRKFVFAGIILAVCFIIAWAQDPEYKELNPFSGQLDATRSDAGIDLQWLRLNTANDPLTGNLEIQKATPEIKLTDTGDSDDTRWVRTDSSGRMNLYNTVYKPGGAGKALDFDGLNEYVSVNDDDTLSFGNASSDTPFSISAWIHIDDATKSVVVSKADETTTEYLLGTDGADNWRFWVVDNVSGNRLARSLPGADSYEGIWTHIVGTYDGSGTIAGLKLYINGSISAAGDDSSGSYTAMHNSSALLYLGVYVTPDPNHYTNGKIDEVSVFSQELSANDVSDLYASGAGLFIDKNNTWPTDGGTIGDTLQALWHLDESSGTNVPDASDNTNTGTTQNMEDIDWVTGKVPLAGSDNEINVISAKDGVDPSQGYIIEIGESTNPGEVIIYGDEQNWNINSTTRMNLDANGTLTVNNSVAAAQQLILKAAPSASENIQEWQDSVSAILANVDETGKGFFTGLDAKDNNGTNFGDISLDSLSADGTSINISSRLDIQTDKMIIGDTYTDEGINEVIDALGTEGGEGILLEGSYTIDGVCTIDQSYTMLRGSGWGTILDANAWSTDHVINLSVNHDYGIIRDLQIIGNTGGGNPKDLIYGDSTSTHWLLENLYLKDSDQAGILTSAWYTRISKCYLDNNDYAGILFGGRYSTVESNISLNAQRGLQITGIWDVVQGNISTVNTYGFLIAGGRLAVGNNIAYNNSIYGYEISNNRNLVSNNLSEQSGRHGFHVLADSNTLNGNVSYYSGNAYNSFHFNTANFNTITGNAAEGAAGRAEYGFYLQDSSNNVLMANSTKAHDTGGTFVDADSDKNLILFIAGEESITVNGDSNLVYAVDQTVTDGGTNNIIVKHDTASQDINYNCSNTFSTDNKIYFRDTAISINSNDDGHLDLAADISIDLNTGADTDLVLNFAGTTNSGVLTWMEDEDYFKVGDEILMDSIEKINFRDTAIGIYSQADTFLDIFADGAVRIGDSSAGAPTNYLKISSDGTVDLVGTARVKRHVHLPLDNFLPGAQSPTSATIGHYSGFTYSQAVTQTATAVWHVPEDWDTTTDMVVHLHWAPIDAAAGDVVWDIDYKATASEANEIISGTQRSLSTTDSTQTLQYEHLQTADMTIPAGDLALLDMIGICLSRDTADAADTYGAGAFAFFLEIIYTANKLGEDL
jgi:hypothetical protein